MTITKRVQAFKTIKRFKNPKINFAFNLETKITSFDSEAYMYMCKLTNYQQRHSIERTHFLIQVFNLIKYSRSVSFYVGLAAKVHYDV